MKMLDNTANAEGGAWSVGKRRLDGRQETFVDLLLGYAIIEVLVCFEFARRLLFEVQSFIEVGVR